MTTRWRILVFASLVLMQITSAPLKAKQLSPKGLCATEWRQGNFQICETAAKEHPGDVDVLRNLAKAHIEVADFDAALQVFEHIAETWPNDPKAYEDLAGTLGFIRAYGPALRAMNRVLELRPARVADYRALAIIYISLNNPEAAASMTEYAAEMGDAVAMFDLRGLYAEGAGVEKDLEKAFAWAIRAAEAGHLGAMALMSEIYLEGLYGQKEDEARAIEWAERLRAADRPL